MHLNPIFLHTFTYTRQIEERERKKEQETKTNLIRRFGWISCKHEFMFEHFETAHRQWHKKTMSGRRKGWPNKEQNNLLNTQPQPNTHTHMERENYTR